MSAVSYTHLDVYKRQPPCQRLSFPVNKLQPFSLPYGIYHQYSNAIGCHQHSGMRALVTFYRSLGKRSIENVVFKFLYYMIKYVFEAMRMNEINIEQMEMDIFYICATFE